MRRQAAAQAQQAQEEVCISAKESFELVRCLLRVSIYHVSFLRGLFPDSMFTGAKMNNLGGVTVQMLGGDGVTLSSDAQQLKDWVEKGVLDAVRACYLKKMYFGIAADPDCINILEEFVFTFQYGAEGAEMKIDAAAGGVQRATIDNLGGKGAAGQGKSVSVKQVKNQIFRLMRTLVELCGTLEEVPETRHIFMRLTYHDDAPDGYEPPHFAAATEEQANGAFAAQPFSMKAGSLATDHHRVSVRVKSLLDAVEPGAGREEHGGHAAAGGEDDIAYGADGLGPRATAVNGGGAGLTAAAAAAAAAPPLAVKGDEGDEGGAGVEWSVGHGAGGGGQAAMEEERVRPQGIRREEARGQGPHGGDLLGQSQEVEGPPAGRCDDANMVDAAAPQQPDEEGGGTGTPPPSDMTSGGGGGDCDDDAQGAMHALEELSLGAGLAPPPPGCASQSSQQRALDAVRCHVLARVARGGSVEKLDAAAKFCSVPMVELDRLFDVLVAEGELVAVGGDRFARPGGGDSGERAGGRAAAAAPPPPPPPSPLRAAAAMPPPPARRDGAAAPTPRGKRAAPARSPRGRGAGGGAAAPAAAAHHSVAPAADDGAGMGAFDPDAPPDSAAAAAAAGGAPGAVFDSSQTSRLGEGGAKRRRTKTSFCTAPISQGAIPGGGGGAEGAVPGDSATAAGTTPNRSNNRTGCARAPRRR